VAPRQCRCGGELIIDAMDDARKQARARGKEMGLSYAGALLPAEAHALMQAGAKLIDVRTKPELLYVGRIPGSIDLEWQTYPGSMPNADFIAELSAVARKDEIVMFICRSGVRSHSAAEAAMRAGYVDAYNVLEGFEGDKDKEHHRNTLGGWRKAGLP